MGANDNTASLKCFKAYDIRGNVPDQLNAEFAFALGRACGETFSPKSAVVGLDARLSGPMLENALVAGLEKAGVDVVSIGICGTEEIYFAAANYPFDLGIMITGSHNPTNENGFKIVRGGAIPVSADSGLKLLEKNTRSLLADTKCNNESGQAHANAKKKIFREDWLRWMLDYSGVLRLPARNEKPLKILTNSGNGCAGPVLVQLQKYLPFEFININGQPDGSFPNGVPNPLLPQCREETAQATRENNADLGVAFDGDFDRCFFYDRNGGFVESCYLIGLLAAELLASHPGEKIVHDTRVYWNTREQTLAAGGIPVMGKTGHAFMKEKMRAENALYGGEMSAHHYFRDFAFCDSGMLTMLAMLALLHKSEMRLDEIMASRIAAWPCSGEINFRVNNVQQILDAISKKYAGNAAHMDDLDGINMEFAQWRFNLRPSNTEPLLRLNVEARKDKALVDEKTEELSKIIHNTGGIE